MSTDETLHEPIEAHHVGHRAHATHDLPPPEPMRAVDRAWLDLDQAGRGMIVHAILELQGVHDAERLGRIIADRLARQARFRQCADLRRSPGAWVTQPALDYAYHVRVLRPKGIETAQGLRRTIAWALENDLDHAHPLWRITLYAGPRGKVTVLFAAHHAIADGVGLIQLLLRVMDGHSNETAPVPNGHAGTVHGGPLGPLIDQLDSANEALISLKRVVRYGLEHPRDALRQGRAVLGGAAAIGQLLANHGRNPKPLQRALSGQHRVDWSDTLPLEALKASARACECTLNDLFLAALAGAFGEYLRQHGALDARQTLRVAIPVNLRRPGDVAAGNHFGLVLLDLPVGITDAKQRRRAVAQRMTQLKKSAEAHAVLTALAAVGRLPSTLGRHLVNRVASSACAVVSNLPGPERPLHLGSARLSHAIFWPPQTGDIGLGISVLSYAGGVILAVSSDTGVLEDPAALVGPFQRELEQLIAAPTR